MRTVRTPLKQRMNSMGWSMFEGMLFNLVTQECVNIENQSHGQFPCIPFSKRLEATQLMLDAFDLMVQQED